MVYWPLISLALILHVPPDGNTNVIHITPPPLPDQASDGIKFIGAGLSRTGTQSLWHALKILGYHPAHGELFNGMCQTYPNMTVKEIWVGPTTSQNEDVRLATLLERGYNATTPDVPLGEFWKNLKHRFPEAPVVLTQHPGGAEGWASSILKHRRADGSFNEKNGTPSTYMDEYEEENEKVRQACRMNNWTLLEFKPTDGWGPLCNYLGLPVPTSPYPHIDVQSRCDPIAGIPYLSLKELKF